MIEVARRAMGAGLSLEVREGGQVTVKVINQDSIDFLVEGFGVRVRKDTCRSLILENDRWLEYGAEFRIPVEAEYISMPKTSATSLTSLACNVLRYEDSVPRAKSDLRKLLTGELPFEEARRKR